MPKNRPPANPSGAHPMQRSMAARAGVRTRFSSWLGSKLAGAGVPTSDRPRFPHSVRAAYLIENLGVSHSTAFSWLKGQSQPKLFQLPALAELLGVSLSETCTAAGRPPSDAVRLRYSSDPSGALPALMNAWRSERKLSHPAVAALSGLSAYTWCRLEAGHRPINTLVTLVKVADTLGLTPTQVAAANRAVIGAPEALDVPAALASTTLACTLRTGRKARGLRLGVVAAAAGVSTHRLSRLELGLATSLPVTAILPLAELLGTSAAGLLRESGISTGTTSSCLLADALDGARLRTTDVSFGATITAARKSAGKRVYQVANQSGVTRFHLSRCEHDHVLPSVRTVVSLADALDTELADLLASWQPQLAAV